MRRPCYSFRSSKIDIVAVLFFFNASTPQNFFFNFHQTLTANNSGSKPPNSKTTTFSETLGRALSHGLPCLGHTSGKHREKCVFVSRVFIKNGSLQLTQLHSFIRTEIVKCSIFCWHFWWHQNPTRRNWVQLEIRTKHSACYKAKHNRRSLPPGHKAWLYQTDGFPGIAFPVGEGTWQLTSCAW